MKPRWQITLASCSCAAALVYTYVADPVANVFPGCLLYQATGIYCAGCGATRAAHALLHGRVLEALHDNLLFVAISPVLIAVVQPLILRAWRTDRWPVMALDQRAVVIRGVALFTLGISFMIARNMPGWPFDFLRPPA